MDDLSNIGSYTPPQIEVIELILEKGFASSVQNLDESTW
jgi:hypothetical protein